MNTLDEMRQRHLLTTEQYTEIRAWIAKVRTPEGILGMPAHLWKALALASMLMNLDGELLAAFGE